MTIHKTPAPIQRPCNNKNKVHYFKVDEKPTKKFLENGYWACCKRCDYKYFFIPPELNGMKSTWGNGNKNKQDSS